jgi:hypothetical protein
VRQLRGPHGCCITGMRSRSSRLSSRCPLSGVSGHDRRRIRLCPCRGSAAEKTIISQDGATNYRFAVARVTLRKGESRGAEPHAKGVGRKCLNYALSDCSRNDCGCRSRAQRGSSLPGNHPEPSGIDPQNDCEARTGAPAPSLLRSRTHGICTVLAAHPETAHTLNGKRPPLFRVMALEWMELNVHYTTSVLNSTITPNSVVSPTERPLRR